MPFRPACRACTLCRLRPGRNRLRSIVTFVPAPVEPRGEVYQPRDM